MKTTPQTILRFLSKIVIFSGLLSVLFSACKTKNSDVIPDTFVDFTIDLNNPRFIDLNVVGNTLAVTASDLGIFSLGYNNHGILIYRASEEEFYAFDRTCPFEEDLSQIVQVDNAGDVTAECPVCHTEYVLPSFGYPTDKGPGVYPLKKYQANLSGSYLRIYNR